MQLTRFDPVADLQGGLGGIEPPLLPGNPWIPPQPPSNFWTPWMKLGGWSRLEVEEDQSSRSGPANQEIPPARSTGPNCPAAHSAHCPPTDHLTHHTPSPTPVRLRQFPNPPIQIPSSAPHSRVTTRVDETSRRGGGRAEAEDQGRRWETGGRGRLRGSQQQGLGRSLERSATQPDRAAARTRSLLVSVRGGGGGQGRVTDAVLVWPRGCRWPGAPESARGPVDQQWRRSRGGSAAGVTRRSARPSSGLPA